MDEIEYRKHIQDVFDRIESAFENVDPDVAECESQFGALSVRLASGARCILSSQPSVRQLWLALAAKGEAFHFNWDAVKNQWIDDKGRGIEVLSYLRGYFKDAVQLELAI